MLNRTAGSFLFRVHYEIIIPTWLLNRQNISSPNSCHIISLGALEADEALREKLDVDQPETSQVKAAATKR